MGKGQTVTRLILVVHWNEPAVTQMLPKLFTKGSRIQCPLKLATGLESKQQEYEWNVQN